MQGPGRRVLAAVVLSFFVIFLIPFLATIFSSGRPDDALRYHAAAEQFYLSQEYDSAYLNYKRALQLDPELVEAMVG